MIDGSLELIQKLFEKKKNVFFVTNNSTRSRDTYVQKFNSKGFKDVTKENILCSSYAAARYLALQNFKGKVYVIGEHGIYEELEEHGIEYIGNERQHLTLGTEPPPRGQQGPVFVELQPESGVYYHYFKFCFIFFSYTRL